MKKTLIQVAMLAILFSCSKNYELAKENELPLTLNSKEALLSKAHAFKERNDSLVERPPANIHMNEKIEKHLTEILEPVRNQLIKAIEKDGTDRFKRYEEAVLQAKNMKEYELQVKAMEHIRDEFYPFIRELWEKAGIDENKFQQAILGCFPESIRKGIVFQEFLNFTIGPSEKPEPPLPPAPPAPENICVNAHDFMHGAYSRDGFFIGGVRITIRRSPGGGGSAFAMVNTSAISAGAYTGCAWLMNNMTVPGTFIEDARQIRYKADLLWTGVASAVAVIGGSWSTIAYLTDANATRFDEPGGEIYTAVAPVIFVCIIRKSATVDREQLLDKTDIKSLNFGGAAYGQSKSMLIFSTAFATAGSVIDIMGGRWTACEE